MLSKAINNVVDPNWKYIATADKGRKIGWFDKSVIKYTIIKATYGHADVTDKVKKMYSGGESKFTANNYDFKDTDEEANDKVLCESGEHEMEFKKTCEYQAGYAICNYCREDITKAQI